MSYPANAPTVLLVGGAGPAPAGIDVAVMALRQARSHGFRTHLINHESSIRATRPACELADEVSAVDFDDVDRAVAWAGEQVAGGARFDVVFTYRELAVQATAAIAASVGATGNPPEAVRRIQTKDLARTHLAEAGFRQPAWRLCGDVADARSFLGGGPGPWVVKPRAGAGSEGVSLVRCPGDLEAAIRHLPEPGEPFLVEEFVHGDEFSADGLFLDGRPWIVALTAKEKTPLPYFVEVGHTLPAPLPPALREDAERTVAQALTCLELRSGVFHAEFWLTPQGLVMGEVHVRIGGGYIHHLLPYAMPGLDLFGLVFDDALGRCVRPPESGCVRAAASRYFEPPPGRLKAIEGWDEMAAHPSVLLAEMPLRPGDLISALRSSDDRIGPVVAGAETAAEAGELARELAESVRFHVEPI